MNEKATLNQEEQEQHVTAGLPRSPGNSDAVPQDCQEQHFLAIGVDQQKKQSEAKVAHDRHTSVSLTSSDEIEYLLDGIGHRHKSWWEKNLNIEAPAFVCPSNPLRIKGIRDYVDDEEEAYLRQQLHSSGVAMARCAEVSALSVLFATALLFVIFFLICSFDTYTASCCALRTKEPDSCSSTT